MKMNLFSFLLSGNAFLGADSPKTYLALLFILPQTTVVSFRVR
jgi:hypothetical protein